MKSYRIFPKSPFLRFILVAYVVLAVGMLMACEGPIDDDPFDTCSASASEDSVLGDWTISANGEWGEGCENKGSFELNSAQPLKVVPRSAASNIEFGLAKRISFSGGTFDLEGAQAGSCINFTTTETTSSSQVAYRFDGRVDYTGRLIGEFTGTGPDSCKSSGTFTVDIQ